MVRAQCPALLLGPEGLRCALVKHKHLEELVFGSVSPSWHKTAGEGGCAESTAPKAPTQLLLFYPALSPHTHEHGLTLAKRSASSSGCCF